ncbi:MAG: hypothetical protein LBE74_01285 [Treponema sp.]|jgi:hypothetical protein|nr:hypothetical protein [Treponema sp.]
MARKALRAAIGVAVLLSCAANTQTLRGYVQTYGAEPHTYAGIVSGGKVYAVYPPEKEAELRKLQGQTLEFSVRFLDPPQGEGGLFLKDGCVTPLSWRTLDE